MCLQVAEREHAARIMIMRRRRCTAKGLYELLRSAQHYFENTSTSTRTHYAPHLGEIGLLELLRRRRARHAQHSIRIAHGAREAATSERGEDCVDFRVAHTLLRRKAHQRPRCRHEDEPRCTGLRLAHILLGQGSKGHERWRCR